jgi:rubrerythrin
MSLTAIAKLVLREGCLGETVAALEAVAAAEVASDPVVKRALERIASDELSHADLAFQFLRWALSLSSPEERYELACEAAQQLADFESDARHGERTPTDDRLAAHGLLGSEALGAIHLAAARDVSRPLLAALFEQEPSEA